MKMRPLTNVRVLSWTLAPVLWLACDNGHVDLPPGGPGSGGSGGGAGQGSAGHAPSGPGGASTGMGGNLPTSGGAGFVASGPGGGVATGAGGGISSGAAGRVASGAGGSGAICGALGEVTSCPATFVCGNGTRDICALQWESFGSCQKSQVQEACDGADLGGQTCRSVGGYPTGTLRCSSQCLFDTSGCNACSDDPAIVLCGATPTTLSPQLAAMGASDSMVALAWTSESDATPTIRFTLVTPNLDLVDNVSVKEPALAYAPYSSTWAAVAPLPSGWIVAGPGYLDSGLVFVHAFNAGGVHAARATVPAVGGSPAHVVLVPRPNDGPLMVWKEYTSAYDSAPGRIYAALIAADGRSTTPPVEVPIDDGVLEDIGPGTYAGGAFYVPYVVTKTAGAARQLAIAKLSANGALAGVVEPVLEAPITSPTLLAVGDGLAVGYPGTFDSRSAQGPDTFFVQRLDLSGAPTSEPSSVGASNSIPATNFAGPAFVALGDDVVPVVLESHFPVSDSFVGEGLELLRVSADGQAGPKHPLMMSRALFTSWYAAAAFGDDVVVAWLSSPHLQLIHVRP
jgi:hypothetical protein